MTTIVSDIVAGIEARIESALPTYSPLSYKVDISKNKFKGNYKGYAVLPSSGSETDSTVGAITIDQSFELKLTNSYHNGATSQINDSLQAQRISELNNDLLAVYKDLCINKRLIDSNVMIVNNLSIGEAEFLDNEKIISVTVSFNIKYKINI